MTIEKKRKLQAIEAIGGAYLIIGTIIIVVLLSVFGRSSREKFFEDKRPFADKPTIGKMLKGATVTKESAKSITGYTESIIQYDYVLGQDDTKKDIILTTTLYYDLGNEGDSYDKITYQLRHQDLTSLDFLNILYKSGYESIDIYQMKALGVVENRLFDSNEYWAIRNKSVGGKK